MEEKLDLLYKECINELNNIGIDILNKNVIGDIDIHISKRNNKRYGVCKQEHPDETSKSIKRKGYRNFIKYNKFNVHHIEISPWVMELNDDIIKNTIIHELIHCMPYCNSHGVEFKKYANFINNKLGYNISRVGNKKEDFIKSNITYEEETYKYIVICNGCGQTFYRKRYNKNLTRKYRCGKCGGKLKISENME